MARPTLEEQALGEADVEIAAAVKALSLIIDDAASDRPAWRIDPPHLARVSVALSRIQETRLKVNVAAAIIKTKAARTQAGARQPEGLDEREDS